MQKRSIGAVCAALGFALLGPAPAEAYSAADKARVLFVGDSLAANTLNSVRFWLQATGMVDVFSDGAIFPGMALCDFLEEKPAPDPRAVQTIRTLVQSTRPDLIVMQFWGNAGTPCMPHPPGSAEYYDLYFWDALNAVQQIEGAAAAVGLPRPKIMWVLQGPDRDMRERPQRLNDGYAFAAASYGDRVSDAGWTISMASYPHDGPPKDRYQWVQFLPCTDWERATNETLHLCTHPEAFGGVTQLHRDDDPIHFCLGETFLFFDCNKPSPAIDRYGMRIAADASAWLGI